MAIQPATRSIPLATELDAESLSRGGHGIEWCEYDVYARVFLLLGFRGTSRHRPGLKHSKAPTWLREEFDTDLPPPALQEGWFKYVIYACACLFFGLTAFMQSLAFCGLGHIVVELHAFWVFHTYAFFIDVLLALLLCLDMILSCVQGKREWTPAWFLRLGHTVFFAFACVFVFSHEGLRASDRADALPHESPSASGRARLHVLSTERTTELSAFWLLHACAFVIEILHVSPARLFIRPARAFSDYDNILVDNGPNLLTHAVQPSPARRPNLRLLYLRPAQTATSTTTDHSHDNDTPPSARSSR